VYLLKMPIFNDKKVRITIKYKKDKLSILIPEQTDFTLITEYISRMIQAYDKIDPEEIIEGADPGDENTISNG